MMKFADKGSESAIKICSCPSDCINRNRLQKEKLLELELPRMPRTHLRKPLLISKSGLQKLGSVPSGKQSSWAGQEGALTSRHVRSNDEQISEENWVHTTPPEFNKNIKWKWFFDPLSFFIFLLKSDQQFWYPTLGHSLHFRCVLFLPLSPFAIFIITNRRCEIQL